jgi:hypothetical protein
LWGNGKKQWVILAFCWFIGISSLAQGSFSKKIRFISDPDSLRYSEQLIRAYLTQDLDYFLSLSGFQFLNCDHDKKNNYLVFLQSVKYKVLISKDSMFCLSNILVHDLGFQFIFDSITRIYPDETTLSTYFSLRLHKNFNFILNSDISTRLLNNYDYSADDHGNPVKVLSSSFMTPLTMTFSCGLGLSMPGFGEMNLGISSAKITYIRDRTIFERLNVSDFYGIPKGKNHCLEYGLSLRFLIDKDLFNKVHWNCDILLFKNYLSPVDFSLKNFICFNLNKYIKTSIQTRILYEEKINKNLQLENNVNIGLSIHL